MMPNDNDTLSRPRPTENPGWRRFSPSLILLGVFAAFGLFVIGLLVFRYPHYLARTRASEDYDRNYAGRKSAHALLASYGSVMDVEWLLPEHDRLQSALEIAARNAGRSLADVRAELEDFAVAVRSGRVTDPSDRVCAAVIEGRLHLAAEEAQQIAVVAKAARQSAEQKRKADDDDALDYGREEVAALQLTAATLTASEQDGRAQEQLGIALSLVSRDANSHTWGNLQLEIGRNHLRLARQLPSRAGRDHLDQAIAALRLADEAMAGWYLSSDRAELLFMLGSTMLDRAERSVPTDAEPLAAEAARVLQRALAGHDRRRSPSDWIATRQRLTTAQDLCGDPLSATEQVRRARKAVSSIRSCAERIDPARSPREWAVAQSELGDALQDLASCVPKSACETLTTALAAHRHALERAPRNRNPVLWSLVQNRLADTLFRLAELGGEAGAVGFLNEAASACRASLDVLTRDQAPILWAKAQWNLARILFALEQRGAGQGGVAQAEAQRASATALTVLTGNDFPRLHAELVALRSGSIAKRE